MFSQRKRVSKQVTIAEEVVVKAMFTKPAPVKQKVTIQVVISAAKGCRKVAKLALAKFAKLTKFVKPKPVTDQRRNTIIIRETKQVRETNNSHETKVCKTKKVREIE